MRDFNTKSLNLRMEPLRERGYVFGFHLIGTNHPWKTGILKIQLVTPCFVEGGGIIPIFRVEWALL